MRNMMMKEQLSKEWGKFQMQEKCKICYHYFVKYERCMEGNNCRYDGLTSDSHIRLLKENYAEDYTERVKRGWIDGEGKPVQLKNEELRCEI